MPLRAVRAVCVGWGRSEGWRRARCRRAATSAAAVGRRGLRGRQAAAGTPPRPPPRLHCLPPARPHLPGTAWRVAAPAPLQFQPPFAGMDPVEAARQAALYERRPEFVALMQPHPQKKVGAGAVLRGGACLASCQGKAGARWSGAGASGGGGASCLRPAEPVPAPCAARAAPQELRELITRCWAPSAEDRPPFAQLVKELEAILAKIPRTVMVKQGGGGGAEGGCCTLS